MLLPWLWLCGPWLAGVSLAMEGNRQRPSSSTTGHLKRPFDTSSEPIVLWARWLDGNQSPTDRWLLITTDLVETWNADIMGSIYSSSEAKSEAKIALTLMKWSAIRPYKLDSNAGNVCNQLQLDLLKVSSTSSTCSRGLHEAIYDSVLSWQLHESNDS